MHYFTIIPFQYYSKLQLYRGGGLYYVISMYVTEDVVYILVHNDCPESVCKKKKHTSAELNRKESRTRKPNDGVNNVTAVGRYNSETVECERGACSGQVNLSSFNMDRPAVPTFSSTNPFAFSDLKAITDLVEYDSGYNSNSHRCPATRYALELAQSKAQHRGRLFWGERVRMMAHRIELFCILAPDFRVTLDGTYACYVRCG